jgi:hypothetical protein
MKDAVHHVYIHSANFIQKFGNDFPNASELTLSKTFNQPSDSIVPSLNRIIPLRQLTKLTLGWPYYFFRQVIEFLQFTPNLHTLKLYSILLYPMDSLSMQQNEIFRTVSNTNIITNVTIEKKCIFKKRSIT